MKNQYLWSVVKIYYLLTFLLLSPNVGQAQSPVLDEYIRQGLQSNNAIKQQNFLLKKNMYALEEAKGLFLPSVNFNTQYTLATGGRRIAFPVGDLLNPVYQTLNILTGSDRFPQIANVNEQFLPNDFYDAKFRVIQPILNAEIYYNRKIKREQVSLQKVEIQVFKRELVKDVKTAYFRYLQTVEAIKIYQNAMALVKESDRVNQSLVKNGMATQTVLRRSESEIRKIEAQLVEAENNRKNAQAYLNFLLNQPFENEIKIDSSFLQKNTQFADLSDNVTNREELQKLRTALSINQMATQLNKAYFMPKMGASLDVGSQGFHWKFNEQTRYALLGISLDIPIFAGFRNQNKIRQSQMDVSALQAQYDQVEDQLNLQVQTTQNSYNSAWQIYDSNTAQVEAAKRYMGDIFKKYKQGQANFIEFLDARTDLTTAEIQQSIALSNVWIKWAELERAKASYQIDAN
jgi:outer membrane protein TolC